MTEMEREHLNKARAHLCKDQDGKAMGCYAVVAEVNPDNPEAKFFMGYMDYLESIEQDSAKRKLAVNKLINTLEGAVKYVAAADCSMEEKLAVVKWIVELYTPVPRSAITMRISPIGETIESTVLSLYWLGSYIEKEFQANPKAMKLAIIPWKEAVKQHQKWYAYKYNGIKPEDYVAKIQKVDPAYTMPQKAGCISKG